MPQYCRLVFFIFVLLSSCKTSKMIQAPMLPVFDKQGHRGCRGLMPENTIAAMLKAIDLGVTTLEMDITFTKDGEAILSHEPFYNHNITTLPGGGFIREDEEKKYNIYKMNYGETLQYDVGLKPHPQFPQQVKMAATKPRLKDVITEVESYIKDKKLNPVFYNIETKTKPVTDNKFHPAPKLFVDMLMKIIIEQRISQKVIIQSFDFRTLQIIHRDYPQMKTAALIEDYDKRSLDAQLKDLGFTPTIYSPAHSLVNESVISQCHSRQIKIIPWTVNDLVQINKLKMMGVDGIITDYPNLFNE